MSTSQKQSMQFNLINSNSISWLPLVLLNLVQTFKLNVPLGVELVHLCLAFYVWIYTKLETKLGGGPETSNIIYHLGIWEYIVVELSIL